MDAGAFPSGTLRGASFMRTKSLLLLLIALGCGVVASVAVSQVVLDQKGQGAVQTVGILVVSKNISAASRIHPDSVRVEQWPADKVPVGALTDLKQIEGKFAKQPVYANEPLIEVKLANKGKEVIIPEGYRVFDIHVSDQNGGGGYIGPGDRVDVHGFFEKGVRTNISKSVKVLEDIEVLMVDGVASIDPEAVTPVKKSSSTIQLLVKDRQYAVLDTAANLGKLRLALRPPQRDAVRKEVFDEGDEFMSWLKETESSSTPAETKVAVREPDPTPAPTSVVPTTPNLKHEMVIITPEGLITYRWNEGDKMPKKVEETKDSYPMGLSGSGASSGYAPSNYHPTQPSNPSNVGNPNQASGNPNQASNAATTNAAWGTPGPPSGSSDPNNGSMTWDPASGTWQIGGFKASYPPTK
jgi:pilus assembly protein CpaB